MQDNFLGGGLQKEKAFLPYILLINNVVQGKTTFPWDDFFTILWGG